MQPIHIVREVPIEADDAWKRLTTWENHGRHVPLTTMRRTADGFVARTGIGPVGFDDAMAVVESDPPRFCRIEKRGRVVTGWAEIRIEALSQASCRVTWTESAHVKGVPGFLAGMERRASTLLFSRLLDALLRD